MLRSRSRALCSSLTTPLAAALRRQRPATAVSALRSGSQQRPMSTLTEAEIAEMKLPEIPALPVKSEQFRTRPPQRGVGWYGDFAVGSFLNSIKTGQIAKHTHIRAKPTKLVLAVAQILYEERLIRGYRHNEAEMEVYLRYSMAGRPIIRDIKMITTPGKKVYWKRTEVEFNARIDKNMTLTLISTPLGLMSAAKAKLAKQGGLALAKVYIV